MKRLLHTGGRVRSLSNVGIRRLARSGSQNRLWETRTRGRRLLYVGFAMGAFAVAPTAAGAASRFTITPSHPSSSSTITIAFKVPRELPRGRHWILSLSNVGVRPGQPCATFVEKNFRTRGRKGQILKASFYPQLDIIDNHPTAWCSGGVASSWGVFAASDTRNDLFVTHYHVVALRSFTIS